MDDARPVFLGGTAKQHLLFMVSLCRFQHGSVPLALVHYATWSVVSLALHSIAFTVGGPRGSIVFACVLAAWALRLDVVAGLFFALFQAAYAWTTITVVHQRGLGVVALALAAVVGAIATEVASHHLFQGHGPTPPREVRQLPRSHKLAFVPYFVVTFGLFFLTLDLVMRFLGYRAKMNETANAVGAGWR